MGGPPYRPMVRRYNPLAAGVLTGKHKKITIDAPPEGRFKDNKMYALPLSLSLSLSLSLCFSLTRCLSRRYLDRYWNDTYPLRPAY